MKDDKRITQKDVDEASVRLKPIWGIEPGRYLMVLYGLAALTLAFILLALPGLLKHGTVYGFDTDPRGAAVFVDGAYRASTPCTIFVKSGRRTVTVARADYESQTLTLDVSGRVFGTLIVPKKESRSFSLVPSGEADAVLRRGMAEFARWNLTGAPSPAYQLPMVLSEAALAFVGPATGGIAAPGFAGAALSYASHAVSARDALRAASVLYGRSAALTPASLARLVSAAGEELARDPVAFAALTAYLPAAQKAVAESTAYYRRALDAAVALPAAPVALKRGSVAGLDLVYLPAGDYALTANASLPATGRLEPFALAATETTVAQFRAFVRQNPGWSAANAAALAAGGLAEDDYLSGLDGAAAAEPVRYVSRPAAQAYCDWLSERAPAGFRFALPTEAQWAYAAAAGLSRPGQAVLQENGRSGPEPVDGLAPDAAGFRAMLGNVWEWTADSYSAHPASGLAGRASYPSDEAAVRGGSWANKAESVNLTVRGPVIAASCSAYLGFRVALVPRSPPGGE